MTSLVLIGSGGHANSITGTLNRLNLELLGCVSLEKPKSTQLMNIEWFGSDENFLSKFGANEVKLINAIGYVGKNNIRKDVYEKYIKLGFEFETIIDPTAVIDTSALVKPGVQILANAYIGPNARILENSMINTGTIVEHDVEIGRHVHIAPGSTICGGSRIGQESFIGAGVTIINSLNIGENVLIGAGSAVICNINSGKRIAGIPAKDLMG